MLYSAKMVGNWRVPLLWVRNVPLQSQVTIAIDGREQNVEP
jgi:hypothetical protein